MEGIRKEKYLRFWSGIGLLAFFILWFLPWRFQTNDDLIMMWLISGAYTGDMESYALFLHPLLSWVLSIFYQFAPEIEWYSMLWFILLFLCFYGLLLFLNSLHSEKGVKNIFAVFFLILLLHFGMFLQFTIVAGVSAFSGLLLLTFIFKDHDKQIRFIGYTLLIFSILIRWESFVLISLGWSLYQLMFEKRNISQRLKIRLGLLAAIFCVLFLWKSGYERYSGYADYISYSKARAAVSDHPVFYRLMKSEEIQSPNQWFFFGQWMMDEDEISVDDLISKKAELDKAFYSRGQVQDGLIRLMQVMAAESFKSILILFLLLLYFYQFSRSKKGWIFFGIWLSFMLIFNHFHILNGRVVILFFLPLLFLLIGNDNSLFQKASFRATVILSLFFLFSVHAFNFLKEARGRVIMTQEFEELKEEIPDNSLVVLEGYKENFISRRYDLMHPVPFLSFGWISKSPFQQKAFQRLGLRSFLDIEEFYLFGVDVNEEFYLPEYYKSRGKNFQLNNRTDEDNFILFHFQSAK